MKSSSLKKMNDVITNTSVFENPEIDNVRNIVKDHIKNRHYRFIQFSIRCKWILSFSDNKIRQPISDITTHSYRNINITTNKLFHWFYNSINSAKKQDLELISIREMKIVFRSYFHNITFKHYLDIPKPMIEINLNKKISNNPKLKEVLTQTPTPLTYLLPFFFGFIHKKNEFLVIYIITIAIKFHINRMPPILWKFIT